jgi:hypothetical protein
MSDTADRALGIEKAGNVGLDRCSPKSLSARTGWLGVEAGAPGGSSANRLAQRVNPRMTADPGSRYRHVPLPDRPDNDYGATENIAGCVNRQYTSAMPADGPGSALSQRPSKAFFFPAERERP